MELFLKILFLVLAYLLGSIPFGYVLGKLKGVEIREYGSKNIGATNVGRVLGKKYFYITFLLDSFKGFLFVFLFRFNILPHEWCLLSPMLYGLFAVLGHVFPVFLKFSGGKAVSSGAGALLGYSPIIFLLGITSFIIAFLIKRIVSISSIVAASVALISCIAFSLLKNEFLNNVFTTPETKIWPLNIWFVIFSTLIVLLIFIRHISNIKRLANHTESKYILKK